MEGLHSCPMDVAKSATSILSMGKYFPRTLEQLSMNDTCVKIVFNSGKSHKSHSLVNGSGKMLDLIQGESEKCPHGNFRESLKMEKGL